MVNSSSGWGSRKIKPGRWIPRPKSDKPRAEAEDQHVIFFKIVDAKTQKPLSRAKYEIADESGKVIARGEADWQGTARKTIAKPGNYKVRVLEVPRKSGAPAACEEAPE